MLLQVHPSFGMARPGDSTTTQPTNHLRVLVGAMHTSIQKCNNHSNQLTSYLKLLAPKQKAYENLKMCTFLLRISLKDRYSNFILLMSKFCWCPFPRKIHGFFGLQNHLWSVNSQPTIDNAPPRFSGQPRYHYLYKFAGRFGGVGCWSWIVRSNVSAKVLRSKYGCLQSTLDFRP